MGYHAKEGYGGVVMSRKEGLKRKYRITKADGSPTKGRYFVLKIDSKDEDMPHGTRRIEGDNSL